MSTEREKRDEASRHSWVKITGSVEVCCQCWAHRRNLITQDSQWAMTEYIRVQPDGTMEVQRRAGTCMAATKEGGT